MTLLRLLVAGLGLGFAAVIVWAAGRASFGDSFARITADPWGLVTLVDLYVGFALFGVVIALFERNAVRVAAWLAATAVLGNLVVALWLAWRLPALARALRARVRE